MLSEKEKQAQIHKFQQRIEKLAHNTGLNAPEKIVAGEQEQLILFKNAQGRHFNYYSHPNKNGWLLAIGTWFYNNEIGTGDEDQLLNLFRSNEPHIVANGLAGFFTIILKLGGQDEVIVITDICGNCHTYVAQKENVQCISSSSLFLEYLHPAQLDPVGCQEFIQLGSIYGSRTFYADVKKLEPAHVYTYKGPVLNKKYEYWKPGELNPFRYKGDEAIDAAYNEITTSARAINRKFNAVLCDLTGGYDSRLMVSGFVTSDQKINTVVSGQDSDADVIIAKRLADIYGLNHRHRKTSIDPRFSFISRYLPYTDGEYNLIEYSRIGANHQELAQKFDISVNGSFGELARGYWWELLIPKVGTSTRLNHTRIASKRYDITAYDNNIINPADRLNMTHHMAEHMQEIVQDLKELPNTFQMDYAYLRMRMRSWQGSIASSTNKIWPALSFFMLKNIVEIFLQVQPSIRRRNLFVRKILARKHPEFAKIPLEHGYPASPLSVANFYKFWPVPRYYLVKIGQKLLAKSGMSTPRSSLPQAKMPARMQLWHEDQVKQMLNPDSMHSLSLFDVDVFANFLENSQSEQFRYNEQWERIFTLEMTLRLLNDHLILP